LAEREYRIRFEVCLTENDVASPQVTLSRTIILCFLSGLFRPIRYIRVKDISNIRNL